MRNFIKNHKYLIYVFFIMPADSFILYLCCMCTSKLIEKKYRNMFETQFSLITLLLHFKRCSNNKYDTEMTTLVNSSSSLYA